MHGEAGVGFGVEQHLEIGPGVFAQDHQIGRLTEFQLSEDKSTIGVQYPVGFITGNLVLGNHFQFSAMDENVDCPVFRIAGRIHQHDIAQEDVLLTGQGR